MVFRPRFLAQLLILCCISTLSLGGETIRTPVVAATIPDGWAKGARGGAVTFTGPGSAVLSFEAAEEIDELFNDWFPKRWETVLRGHTGLEATPIDWKESRKGYRTALVAGSMEAAPGYLWVLFFAANKGRLVQPVVFITKDAASYDSLTSVVAGILNSIEFGAGTAGRPNARTVDEILASLAGAGKTAPPGGRTPERPAPAPSNRRPGAIEGIYAGITTSSNQSVHGGWITEVVREHVLFTPGGTVCWCLPEEGLEGLEDSKLWASGGIVGKYEESANQVVVHWRSGSESVYPLLPDGRIEIRGAKYERLFPGDGLKLNGTYTRFSGSNGSTITFRPDGRFSDTGVLVQTGVRHRGGNYAPLNPPPTGTGRYRVGHYALTLSYDSGVVENVGFYVIPAEMKDPVSIIRLNSFGFQRVGQ